MKAKHLMGRGHETESRMRVLLLTTSFPVTPGASSGIFVERLAHNLGKKCRLLVVAPAGLDKFQTLDSSTYRLSTFNYAPRRWQLLAHGGGGIPAAIAANPWLRLLVPFFLISMSISCMRNARHVDLIFANWSICGVVAGMAGVIFGKPVITTVRGEDANRAKESWKYRMLINLCLRLCNRMVTVSDEISVFMKEMFPQQASKIVMIPNGVELISYDKKKVTKNADESICIIMIGSLIKRKSIHTMLESLANLPARFQVTIVGEGPEYETLSALAKNLRVGARTRFVGHVPPEEIQCWLARADVLVMSSISEGRPNAVLEAMAAGLAVVGSDIPGIRELIDQGETGCIFPVGDVDALSACLRRIEDDDYRYRLGKAARQAVIDRGLTWNRCGDEYMQLFKTTLTKRAM